MRKFFFGSRKRVVATAMALALVTAGSAAAGWYLFSVSGDLNGHFGSAQSATITFSGGSNTGTTALLPGGVADLQTNATNPTSQPATISSVSQTAFQLGNMTPACATQTALHIALVPSAFVGIVVPPGTSVVDVPGAISADATTPICAQGGSINITVSGSGS